MNDNITDNFKFYLDKINKVLDKTDSILRETRAPYTSGANPSTALDVEIDNILKKELSAILSVPFFSEESPNDFLTNDLLWIVDSIDGTINSIVGNESFVTSIALVEPKAYTSILSVISAPILNFRLSAAKGKGSFLNDKPIIIRDEILPNILSYGLAVDSSSYLKTFYQDLRKLSLNSWTLRQTGSAALDMCRVATGNWSAYYQKDVFIWDIAGAELIVSESGGNIVRKKADSDKFKLTILASKNTDIENLLLKTLSM